jgi:integrase/recombinase XerD
MKHRKAVTSFKAQRTIEVLMTDSPKTTSFNKLAAEFLKHCRIKGLSPETVKFYKKGA